jgi:hypothetical protein
MLVVKDTDTGEEHEFPGPPAPAIPVDQNEIIPAVSGVYFAYATRDGENECVYVGESKNMRQRLEHRPELRETVIGVLECDRSQRKRLESLYIAVLNPRLNAQASSNHSPQELSEKAKSLILRATEENASKSKSGRAHYITTSRLCHARPKSVRAAWKVLAAEGKIDICGDFATVRRQDVGRFPEEPCFIVLTGRDGEPKGKSHKWLGKDTACRMWSTGGLPTHKSWDHRPSPPTEVCNQCSKDRRQAAKF